MGICRSDCVSTSNSIVPPLRSISAPAAITRPPASSTTWMVSIVEPPGPHILDHEDVLLRLDLESAAQRHHPARVSLRKQRRNASSNRAFRLWQRSRNFLSDDEPADCWRNNGVHSNIRKQLRQGLPEFFREPRVLQHQRALHVRSAVPSTRELKMPMPDGAGRLEHLKYFLALQHGISEPSAAPKRRILSGLAVRLAVLPFIVKKTRPC